MEGSPNETVEILTQPRKFSRVLGCLGLTVKPQKTIAKCSFVKIYDDFEHRNTSGIILGGDYFRILVFAERRGRMHWSKIASDYNKTPIVRGG